MRRNRAIKRIVAPDAQYRSRLVQQVINKVMLDGKKSTAERIVYDALAVVGERTGRNPTDVLDEAIRELTPVLEVRSRRVGGATYQVPVEVPRAAPAPSPSAGSSTSPATATRSRCPTASPARSWTPLPAGRRLQAQGRHLPHGAGQQSLRPLPLVAGGRETPARRRRRLTALRAAIASSSLI